MWTSWDETYSFCTFSISAFLPVGSARRTRVNNSPEVWEREKRKEMLLFNPAFVQETLLIYEQQLNKFYSGSKKSSASIGRHDYIMRHLFLHMLLPLQFTSSFGLSSHLEAFSDSPWHPFIQSPAIIQGLFWIAVKAVGGCTLHCVMTLNSGGLLELNITPFCGILKQKWLELNKPTFDWRCP